MKPGAQPGLMQLRNNISKGIFIGINANGGTIATKDTKFSHLILEIQTDSYISFKSALNPAHYMRFLSRGGPGIPRDATVLDDAAKFFVRLEVSRKNYHITYLTYWESNWLLSKYNSGGILAEGGEYVF